MVPEHIVISELVLQNRQVSQLPNYVHSILLMIITSYGVADEASTICLTH